MTKTEIANDLKKNNVSLRLEQAQRVNAQSLASRLYVRESEIYRFAINFLLNRLYKLNISDCKGSDLLPLFIDIKDELTDELSFNKDQLFRIINFSNANPNKFVEMLDIELLLMPEHKLRAELSKRHDALAFKDAHIITWLKAYFYNKYELVNTSVVESSSQH